MLLLKQLDQLSDLQKVRRSHVRAIEQHHLHDLRLRRLVNGQELFHIIAIDDIFRILRLRTVQFHLPILFQGNSGNSSHCSLHHFHQSVQEDERKLRDLDDLTKGAILSAENNRLNIVVLLLLFLIFDLLERDGANLSDVILIRLQLFERNIFLGQNLWLWLFHFINILLNLV